MQPKSPRISALDDVGNPDAPPGSAAWARWFVLRAKKYRKDLESDAAALQELIDKLSKYEAWKALKYASFDMLCQVEIGLSDDELDKLREAKTGETVGAVLGRIGRPRKSEQKDNVIIFSPGRQGTDSTYLTARIARDNPEIKARLDAGEFPSVRAAALEAGIVQPSFQCPADPLKASRRLLKHFGGEALTTLLTELANHAGYDLTPRR